MVSANAQKTGQKSKRNALYVWKGKCTTRRQKNVAAKRINL